jgi:hypothetical protein
VNPNDVLTEPELASALGRKGWEYSGFTPCGISGVPGIHRAERGGSVVASQAAALAAGLLKAVERFEAHEQSSKEDVHDVRS